MGEASSDNRGIALNRFVIAKYRIHGGGASGTETV